jgi:hypothetical protein
MSPYGNNTAITCNFNALPFGKIITKLTKKNLWKKKPNKPKYLYAHTIMEYTPA